MKKLTALRHTEDLDDTILAHLIHILPGAIADHFAIHDPKGLDQDVIIIQWLLTTITPATTINYVTTPRHPDQPRRQSKPP